MDKHPHPPVARRLRTQPVIKLNRRRIVDRHCIQPREVLAPRLVLIRTRQQCARRRPRPRVVVVPPTEAALETRDMLPQRAIRAGHAEQLAANEVLLGGGQRLAIVVAVDEGGRGHGRVDLTPVSGDTPVTMTPGGRVRTSTPPGTCSSTQCRTEQHGQRMRGSENEELEMEGIRPTDSARSPVVSRIQPTPPPMHVSIDPPWKREICFFGPSTGPLMGSMSGRERPSVHSSCLPQSASIDNIGFIQ